MYCQKAVSLVEIYLDRTLDFQDRVILESDMGKNIQQQTK